MTVGGEGDVIVGGAQPARPHDRASRHRVPDRQVAVRLLRAEVIPFVYGSHEVRRRIKGNGLYGFGAGCLPVQPAETTQLPHEAPGSRVAKLRAFHTITLASSPVVTSRRPSGDMTAS